MPTVTEKNLLENRDLCELPPAEIILTDNGRGFISIKATASLVADEKDDLQTYDPQSPTGLRPLTQTERAHYYLQRSSDAKSFDHNDDASLDKAIQEKESTLTSGNSSEHIAIQADEKSIPHAPLPEFSAADEKQSLLPRAETYEQLNSVVLFNMLTQDNDFLNGESLSLLLRKRKNKEKDLQAALNYLETVVSQNGARGVALPGMTELSDAMREAQRTLSADYYPKLAELAYRAAIAIKKPRHLGNLQQSVKFIETELPEAAINIRRVISRAMRIIGPTLLYLSLSGLLVVSVLAIAIAPVPSIAIIAIGASTCGGIVIDGIGKVLEAPFRTPDRYISSVRVSALNFFQPKLAAEAGRREEEKAANSAPAAPAAAIAMPAPA